jgi:hypothetical protein
MTSTYARITGMGKAPTLTDLRRRQMDTGPVIDTKQKVTMGLGASHGLRKLYDEASLSSLLNQVSTFKFKEYFLDFDRLRKGFVCEDRFRSALGD